MGTEKEIKLIASRLVNINGEEIQRKFQRYWLSRMSLVIRTSPVAITNNLSTEIINTIVNNELKRGNKTKQKYFKCLDSICAKAANDDISSLIEKLIIEDGQSAHSEIELSLQQQDLAKKYYLYEIPLWQNIYGLFVRAEALSKRNRDLNNSIMELLKFYNYHFDERSSEENFKAGKYRINKEIDEELYGEVSKSCPRGTIIAFDTRAIVDMDGHVIRKSKVILSTGK